MYSSFWVRAQAVCQGAQDSAAMHMPFATRHTCARIIREILNAIC